MTEAIVEDRQVRRGVVVKYAKTAKTKVDAEVIDIADSRVWTLSLRLPDGSVVKNVPFGSGKGRWA